MKFELDRSKIPAVEIKQSVYNSFDEHYVIYSAGEWSFESPAEDDIQKAEEAIYSWIAWYERLLERKGS